MAVHPSDKALAIISQLHEQNRPATIAWKCQSQGAWPVVRLSTSCRDERCVLSEISQY